MNTDEPLASAVVELETRQAFHEDGLRQLDETVAGLQRELLALTRRVEALVAAVNQLRSDVEQRPGDDQPPPHY